jgi:hypothetical protein
MPTYCFKCDICLRTEEIHCASDVISTMQKPCCNNKMMRRDWHAEQFGGVMNRSKGIYPLDCENLGLGTTTVHSYQEHQRILKSQRLVINEPSSESRYRHKHARDRG